MTQIIVSCHLYVCAMFGERSATVTTAIKKTEKRYPHTRIWEDEREGGERRKKKVMNIYFPVCNICFAHVTAIIVQLENFLSFFFLLFKTCLSCLKIELMLMCTFNRLGVRCKEKKRKKKRQKNNGIVLASSLSFLYYFSVVMLNGEMLYVFLCQHSSAGTAGELMKCNEIHYTELFFILSLPALSLSYVRVLNLELNLISKLKRFIFRFHWWERIYLSFFFFRNKSFSWGFYYLFLQILTRNFDLVLWI